MHFTQNEQYVRIILLCHSLSIHKNKYNLNTCIICIIYNNIIGL